MPLWGTADPRPLPRSRVAVTALPPNKSDSLLRTEFLAAAFADPGIDVFKIRVRVEDRHIEVKSRSASITEESRILTLGNRIEGVREMSLIHEEPTHQLQTPPQESSPLPAEEVMRRNVIDRLIADSRFFISHLAVSSHPGGLTIEGEVLTLEERFLINDLVSSLVGSRKIENHIRIRTPRDVSDRRLKKAIVRTLTSLNPYYDPSKIRLVVNRSVVHLSGTVFSKKEATFLIHQIAQIRGVLGIINRLQFSRAQ